MDIKIELMKAIENLFFQVQYRQVLDRLLLLPFDLNELKWLPNNLKKRYLCVKFTRSFYQLTELLNQVNLYQQDNLIVGKHNSYL